MGEHIGTVEWFNTLGYGVVRDRQGRQYFVHYSNLALVSGTRLSPGQWVSFDSRPRLRGQGGLEAYNVELTTAPTPTQSSQAEVATSPTSAVALERAATEVLRFKRELRHSQPQRPAGPLDRDQRLEHPEFGSGQVILSTNSTITVEFAGDVIRSFDRTTLETVLSKPAVVPVPAVKPSLRTYNESTSFGAFMDRLYRETCIALSEEGIDPQGIYRLEEAVDAAPVAALSALDPRVQHAYSCEGITAFYSNQIDAYNALTSGKSVVLCTPTASGKTASFTPAILEDLLAKSGSTALHVFPLVALAGDQTAKLMALNEHLPEADRLTIGVLNSSVARDEKWETQKRDNHIVVTTPDTLHYRLLPNSYPNWERFFKNMRYLVLDEAHVYKGAFGSNVANIVRRVVARCFRLSGRAPQIVIASATVRDPLDLATQLTGYKPDTFVVIDKNGARKPRRHLLITREAAQEICTDLLTISTIDSKTEQPRAVRAIVFSKSIQGTKTGCDRLRKIGRDDLIDRVADFYSDKSDKNDTFARLRNGGIQCIFSTTALMAGIDIGSLDVVIVDGFPGLVMDARQMFGRGGRAGEGAAIFIAHKGNPFDDFYLDNPDLLFSGSTEPVIANPENPLLLSAHLLCASRTGSDLGLNEGPLSAKAARVFGEAGQVAIGSLEEQGSLEMRNGLIQNRVGRPHDEWPLNDLRAMNDREPLIVRTRSGRELEKKRRALAFRDTHPEAIFIHDGQKYQVVRFPQREEKANLILCEPVKLDTGVWTQGVEEFNVRVDRVLVAARGIGQFCITLGDVDVKTSVNAYRRFRTRNVARCINWRCRHESPNIELQRCPKCDSAMRQRQIDEPEPTLYDIGDDYDLTTILSTQAAWLDIKPEALAAYEALFWPRWHPNGADANRVAHPTMECAVASVTNALKKVFPECANCDRDDIVGVCEKNNGQWRIYVYDNFPRGLGLAAEFANDPLPYLRTALEYVERCSCGDEGCPVCLHNFRSRQQTTLSKLAARFLLRHMLDQESGCVLDDLNFHGSFMAPSDLVRKPA